MLNDAQLETLRSTTGDSIYIFGQWLNSGAMWHLIGDFIGLVLSVCLVVFVLNRAFGALGFRARL